MVSALAEQMLIYGCAMQVIDTLKVAAEVGAESVSAYVISMATRASDVLAVELLKREAWLVVSIGHLASFQLSLHYSRANQSSH